MKYPPTGGERAGPGPARRPETKTKEKRVSEPPALIVTGAAERKRRLGFRITGKWWVFASSNKVQFTLLRKEFFVRINLVLKRKIKILSTSGAE